MVELWNTDEKKTHINKIINLTVRWKENIKKMNIFVESSINLFALF